MPELDRYDEADIDDEVNQDVTYEEAQRARLLAERELDRRDAREGVTGRRQRLPDALEGEPIINNLACIYSFIVRWHVKTGAIPVNLERNSHHWCFPYLPKEFGLLRTHC